MAELYTKLAQSIVYSSLWSEDAETCKIWVTVLALKDLDGVFRHNISGISRLTGISLEKCLAAFDKFESPDPLSTSKKEEGRRLLKLEDGGWLVVTHDVYQEFGWSEEKKRQNRERVAAFRERRKQESTSVNNGQQPSTPVNSGPPTVSVNPPAVPEKPVKPPVARPERPDLETVKLVAAKIGMPEVEAEKFFNYYEGNGWMTGRNPVKKWTACLARWKTTAQQYEANRNNGKPNPRNLGMPSTTEQASARLLAELRERGESPA
jgi:hypothetical protein